MTVITWLRIMWSLEPGLCDHLNKDYVVTWMRIMWSFEWGLCGHLNEDSVIIWMRIMWSFEQGLFGHWTEDYLVTLTRIVQNPRLLYLLDPSAILFLNENQVAQPAVNKRTSYGQYSSYLHLMLHRQKVRGVANTWAESHHTLVQLCTCVPFEMNQQSQIFIVFWIPKGQGNAQSKHWRKNALRWSCEKV